MIRGDHVTITGEKELQKLFGRVITIAKNPGRVYKLIGGRMKKMIQGNFKRKANADGSKWAPLSEVTIMLRRKGSGAGRAPIPLRDTDRMYNSIAYKIGPDGVYVGTNVEYAPDLHFGRKGGWVAGGPAVDGVKMVETISTIPARQFVYIQDTDIDILMKILAFEMIEAAFGK